MTRPLVISPPSHQGHSSFVTHVDWSKDSQYLVTNSGDYEILFCRFLVPHVHVAALHIVAEVDDRAAAVFRGGILWQTRDQHGRGA